MDDPGHPSAPPTVAPSPTQPTPSAPTPSKPPQIDEALDDKTALIYSPKAPLAGPDPEKKEDKRAVWGHIPEKFKPGAPEVLVYLHGHNYYVTATLVSGAVKARVPDWVKNPVDGKPVPPVIERGRDAAKKKGDDQGPAGQWYELNQLNAPGTPSVQPCLHQPLILLPEDSRGDNDRQVDTQGNETAYFWATENSQRGVGTLTNLDGLGSLIENCLKRLFDLPKLSGSAHYLGKEIKISDLKRLFLIGHSGGGQPLKAAAKSDLAKKLPTDLVLLDCTYGHDGGGEDFCISKGKANLGSALGQSRMIVVVTGGSTEQSAGALRNRLKDKAVLGLTSSPLINVPPAPASWPTTDILELSHTSDRVVNKTSGAWTRPSATNYEPIKQAMKQSYKVIYIHTNEVHDRIPTVYIPLVLQSAAPAVAPLKITTSSPLKSGVKGEAYSQTLAVDGGVPPYKWSKTAGLLPNGVTLSEQGEISGTPSAGGTVKFTAQVQDDTSATDSKELEVSIMEITTPSPLPSGAKGYPYSQTLTASGGKPPYTWKAAGSLPTGVTLSSAGDISGTPTDNGTFNFTVQVEDSASLTASKAFELFIKWSCFIVGAAYGSELAPEVKFLQELRETVLRQTDWGRRFFETYWRYYYRISPAIAEEMKRDPELQKTIRWSIVEPWTYYMKLLLSRPDWDQVSLERLDPPLRDFLVQLRDDMDNWLTGIELPGHFAQRDPVEAVNELNVILNFVLRTGGLMYLGELVKRGELPLHYEPHQEAELLEMLHQAGRRQAEIDRILYGKAA